jgi:iron complex transport system ATP-binding protein
MIQLDNVTFSYDEVPVLKKLSTGFVSGDFCAIMGPNGSGKTTLLKTIGGLLPHQHGSILIDEHPISDYSALNLARKVAYVPQRQDVVFDFTVFDTVIMGRNPYQGRWEMSNKSDEKLVLDVLEMCHLTHLKDRLLNRLSGGEMQRALVARAMAQQAPVMLLDEPLSNLDINHKFEIMDILAELNQTRKVTILIVIHDFSFAMQYADSALLLKNGELQYRGQAKEVLVPHIIKEVFELGDEFIVDSFGNVSKINIFAPLK